MNQELKLYQDSIQIMLSEPFLVLFNQTDLWCQTFSHIFWLQGSTTPIMHTFFNVEIITSPFDITCPKMKSSASITISFANALIGFKWRNICNKKGYNMLMLYFATSWIVNQLPKKSCIIFMFLKWGSNMITIILWTLVGL